MAKPKDPAFLFYSSDFLTGVSDLTMEERGQYITLLCLQHQKGRLSGKAVALAVANATADVMAKFKQDENGLYYNERLEKEAKKRADHAAKQRERAIKGWEKRKKHKVNQDTGTDATADAAALPLENANVNESISGDKGIGGVGEKGDAFTKSDRGLLIGPADEIPPSVIWVENFMREYGLRKGYSQLDYVAMSEAFCRNYETKGWKINGSDMEKWTYRAETWVDREVRELKNKNQKKVGGKNGKGIDVEELIELNIQEINKRYPGRS